MEPLGSLVMGLLAALVLWVILLALKGSTDGSEPVLKAKPLPEYQSAAMEQLAALPHWRRLKDGSVLDLYGGSLIDICDCRQFDFSHVALYRGVNRRHSMGFVTEAALGQYVCVQKAVARLLFPGPGTDMKAQEPP